MQLLLHIYFITESDISIRNLILILTLFVISSNTGWSWMIKQINQNVYVRFSLQNILMATVTRNTQEDPALLAD